MTADRSIVGRLAAHRLFARAWTRGAVFATLCIVSLLLALFPQRYLASASLTPTNPESLGLSGTLSQLGAINSVFGNQAAVEIAMRVGKSVYVRDAVIAKLKLHQRLDEPSRIWLQRWLDRKVDVRSLRGGIISVEMYDHDPKLARDIVTEYSNAIRLQLAEVSRRQTTYKRDVLLDLVSGANDRLSKAQANYDAFRLTLRTSDPQSAVDSIGLRIPMLEGAIRTKQVQLNIARQLYTDNNIAVKQIKAEMDELERQLADVRRTNPTQASTIGQAVSSSSKLFKLERELGLARTLYDSYLRYLQGTAVEDLTSTASVRILEEPYIDTSRQFYLPAAAAAAGFFLLWMAIEFYRLRPPLGARLDDEATGG